MSKKDEEGRKHLDPQLLGLIDRAEKEPWILVDELRAGDYIELRTENSLYILKLIGPKRGLVSITSNGCLITGETESIVLGSTINGRGTMIRNKGIAVGFRLMLAGIEGGLTMLSATQEVKVNGVKILPVAKNKG